MDINSDEHLTMEQFLERLTLSRSTIHLEPPSVEILTLEEFAEKMKVGETTVWKWIRSGKLRAGRHYIQIERVIRFHWGRELVERLHEDCCTEPTDSEPSEAENTAAPVVRRKRQSYGKHINFDI